MSESFKELFESSPKQNVPRATNVRVGSSVKGVVSHVGPSAVFVELDGKQQGFIDASDLEGEKPLAVGDEVTAVVVSVEVRSGQIRLARRFDKGASVEQLRAAMESAMPVEGKVVGVNKGGLAVEIGGVRAFCPLSQLDLRRVDNPAQFLQQTLEFAVTEVKGERDVVLSRRLLLEKREREAKEGQLTRFVRGTRHHGRVTQLREFGAFVEVDGVTGLVPLRELSHDRGAKPEDVVALGDLVEVEVLEAGIEEGKKGGERLRLTFSLKSLAANPWDAVEAAVPVGRVLHGTVVRVVDFGAFVRLSDGIEGLLPTGELGAKARKASDLLAAGQQVMVVATSVDKVKKRIALVLADEGAAAGATVEGRVFPAGTVVSARVEKVETFGVFVQIEGTKGRAGRGLIPNSELATNHGVDVRKTFPEGTLVKAKILEAGDRMRLSIRRAREDEERADFDSFRASQRAAGGMGTLGDLLKKKIGG